MPRIRDYFDDYYYGYGRRRRAKIAAMTGAIALVAVVVGLAVIAVRNDDNSSRVASAPTDHPGTTPLVDSAPVTETTVERESTEVVVTATSDTVAATESTTGTTRASTPTTARPTTTTRPATTTTRPSTTTTTQPAPTSTVHDGFVPPLAPVETGPVDTLPDGTPVPVVAIFDFETITLTGTVPDQDAVDRLVYIARATSKTPAAVVSNLVINKNVPNNVGVRVIEMNSVGFPSGSAEVLPAHALELDRVAAVMNALPNVSLLVVGHTDQLGDEQENFVVSDARARAVVNYLVSVGIRADRLSSRAVGEGDLIAIGNDAASLALNRRTEFIFGGLLLD